MARRTFDVVDVTEILMHWHAGRSQRELAASLGVDPKTVRKYTAPAVAAGLVPGGAPLPAARWAELVRGWFPQLVDTTLRQVSWPRIAVHHEVIRELLGEVSVSTIHQRLRDEHGLTASLASLRRYVRANLAEEARRAVVTVPRPEVAPGSEGQVDYGLLGRWFEPAAQRLRRVWAFVLVLACSRHLFVRPVLRMDVAARVAAHVAASSSSGAARRDSCRITCGPAWTARTWRRAARGVRGGGGRRAAPAAGDPVRAREVSTPKVGADCHVKVGRTLPRRAPHSSG